jgi:aryl-alcohol dehydrogenase-like predicted oxidoreductase
MCVNHKMTKDWLHRELFGKTVHRLGLAASFGIDEDGIRAAFDRGMNYLYYTMKGDMKEPARAAFGKDRDHFVVAATAAIGYFGFSVRRSAESTLRKLGVDYLDVFQLGWLGVGSAWTEGTLRELRHLKESGKVRALGASIHDRARAGRLAEESPLDLLMIRYNMAHPGAEKDIFPHLAKRKPAVVAYTATRWRKLLRRPSGWDGYVATAADCYRWCLSSPHVDVVLCGPANRAQLDEDLAGVARGPVTPEEDQAMREFGRVVHG